MTRSNRTLNRVILAAVGLVALASAAYVALPLLDDIALPGWLTWTDPVREFRFPELGTTALWLTASGLALIVVLALAWILSRGRGRTSVPVAVDGLEVDVRVIEQLLRDALAPAADVVAVHATAHRLRRRIAVRVRIDARRGSELPRMLAAVDDAVVRLDRMLGTKLPILVHVTSGVRASFSREQRAS